MHGVASTRAFETSVSRVFGEPMDWFFDQWVYGVDVPTYRPRLEVSPQLDQEAPFLLHGSISQEDVPQGFRMLVPIALQFADRPTLVHRVWIDEPTVEVALPLPARPSAIEFNYLDAVIARVR
jgi:aminopeptidase N